LTSLLGFNGERPDSFTGHYLLGNGCRAFNPVLMRFNSPDNLSPFDKGGLNAYSYCSGDPVNRIDPTGNFSFGWSTLDLHYDWLSKNLASRWRPKVVQNITHSNPSAVSSRLLSESVSSAPAWTNGSPNTLRVASANAVDRKTLHAASAPENKVLYETYDTRELMKRKSEFSAYINSSRSRDDANKGNYGPLNEKINRLQEMPRFNDLVLHQRKFNKTLSVLKAYAPSLDVRPTPEPNLVPSEFVSRIRNP
jgi:RHS repeat-associated protein